MNVRSHCSQWTAPGRLQPSNSSHASAWRRDDGPSAARNCGSTPSSLAEATSPSMNPVATTVTKAISPLSIAVSTSKIARCVSAAAGFVEASSNRLTKLDKSVVSGGSCGVQLSSASYNTGFRTGELPSTSMNARVDVFIHLARRANVRLWPDSAPWQRALADREWTR